MAVADVYDALICKRIYKKAMPHDDAVKIMLEGRGTHFDADMLDAFIAIQPEFIAIAQRFADID
jgi:putative two-component system response regulator